MTNSLIYPTIDLYLYDLAQGLGQKPEHLTKNRDNFLNKLPVELRSQVKIPNSDNAQEWDTEFQELSNPPQLDFKFSNENAKLFETYYYPVQLSDTYSLMVDCSVCDRTLSQPAKIITELKDIILNQLSNQTVTLGQTWLITSQVTPEVQTESDFEKLALECYQFLIGSQDKSINKPQIKGKFLEGRYFEWNQPNFNVIPSSDNPTTIQPKNSHIIIILYPTVEQAKKAADFIPSWMRLFCYYHKVLWAYVQSRCVKKLLQTEFAEIQTYIEVFKTKELQQSDFKTLESKLEKADHLFSSYGINLSYLQFQYRTIEVNLYNYHEYLRDFEKAAKQLRYDYPTRRSKKNR
jgi:hypothetical protein